MSYIIWNQEDRIGTAVFLGKAHDRLYWLTCRHVVEDANQSLKIDGRYITVEEEYKFDSDLALLSTAADQGKSFETRIDLGFAMPREMSLMSTQPAIGTQNTSDILKETVPITVAPLQVIPNQTRFQCDYMKTDSMLDEGDSGSPILMRNDANVLVGILSAKVGEKLMVVLFGAMSDADKDKLRDIIKAVVN